MLFRFCELGLSEFADLIGQAHQFIGGASIGFVFNLGFQLRLNVVKSYRRQVNRRGAIMQRDGFNNRKGSKTPAPARPRQPAGQPFVARFVAQSCVLCGCRGVGPTLLVKTSTTNCW